MVRVGFTRSFVLLGFLFVVMHGTKSSLAQARQGFQSDKNDLVLPVHKELLGSDLPASSEGKPGIDGRKMMMHYEAPRSAGGEKKQVQNGGTYSGISSGKNEHPSKRSLTRGAVPCTNQKSGGGISRSEGAFHPPTSDTSDEASSDCRSPMSDQRFSRGSSPTLDPRHRQANPMEAEARRLVEVTEDEIANLMRKDYRGPPKAKRKPPINNRQPSN
ncbi:uncharacterized protein LOC104419456 [Eucalyptus grandis]|uniref:uncharacterized protein LOC104419456 n=1 Tax=Eucalyptus grandis TaxID=71139 RepID=UPI00192E7A80|nr:uncharacterized protein LOC104419456 [Eucalyptus grandis]